MILLGSLTLMVIFIVLLAYDQKRAALVLACIVAIVLLAVIAAALWALCAFGGCWTR